jgi:DNA-binding SARP family transcriptional activator
MARLEVRLLGEIESTLDGHTLIFPTQKVKELFAYLVTYHSHAHPRAALAGLLWPDSDEERAKANLRQTLSRLCKTLGPENELWIVASSGALRFHTKDAWIDVAEFEKLTQALTPSPSPVGNLQERGGEAGVRALEEAITLYRGPFLCGIYEDWVLIEQERLQTLDLEVLEQLAELYRTSRVYEKAIEVWKKALQTVPWHEQAHRELIRLYALVGDRASALSQYHQYVEVLKRELQAKPLPETRALYERLQQGMPLEWGKVIELPSDTPFVGRARELATLQSLWHDVLQVRGQTVLIGGEIGVGKTRFVQHFLTQIQRTLPPPRPGTRRESAGPCVLHGACHALGSESPYQVLLQAVRSGLERTVTETLARLPTLWRSELARFLPELHERFPQMLAPSELAPAQGKSCWFDALTGFFESLARERPFVLFL